MLLHDFILNRIGHGPVGQRLQETRFDAGALRPYWNEDGIPCVTVNLGNGPEEMSIERFRRETGVSLPVHNATTLRKEDYIEFDRAVLRESRKRLRAWADLSASSTFSVNGMAKSILEHETMSDPGEAVVDMDGLTDGRTDSPLFQLEGLPLPITHSDFFFSERQLAMSRNSGAGLDTLMAEAAARRVAETIEKTVIGVETGLAYGGTGRYGTGQTYSRTSQVYGYTNFPTRNTMTGLTTPTGSNPQDTVDDVLTMRDTLYNDNFFGPFMIYHSTDWDRYLDNDYLFTNGAGYAATPTQTLRQRLRQIEGVADVRRLDFMTPTLLGSTFNLIMIQMTSDVARAVNGMGISTVQWDSQGGLRRNFKVMAIHVPQLRATYAGNCGILHATP